jgi:hypothetical protein
MSTDPSADRQHGAEQGKRQPGPLPTDAPAPLPADVRPVDETPYTTADLPPTPQRDRRMPASSWDECPPHLRDLGRDLGYELVAYKRRIGTRWLLWRAGPAVHADARYAAVDVDAIADPARFFTYRLFPDGSGEGTGPDGVVHTRFRSWKESLRDN